MVNLKTKDMVNKKIIVDSILSPITMEDIEILRVNKNKNREFFFLKEEISPLQQEKWFHNFLTNENDFMFVCKEEDKTFGCMGFRLLDEKIDAYNIMRFSPSSFSMEDCMKRMISFSKEVYPGRAVQVRVLKKNPAVSWYKKIGFYQVYEETNYITMYYNN